MKKMYIRIEGDEDACGAKLEVACDTIFLLNAIIQLFKALLRSGLHNEDISSAITCLKECTEIMDKELKGGDKDV